MMWPLGPNMAERTRTGPGLPRRGRRACVATFFACACLSTSQAADYDGVPQNPKIVPIARAGDNATLTRIRLVVNKSETVRIEVPIADVLVGASEITDVIPVSDRTLYMLGKKLGTTNVSLFDSAKKLVGVIDVVVTEDPVIAREASVAAREAIREREAAVEADIRQATGVSGLRVRAQGDRTALMG